MKTLEKLDKSIQQFSQDIILLVKESIEEHLLKSLQPPVKEQAETPVEPVEAVGASLEAEEEAEDPEDLSETLSILEGSLPKTQEEVPEEETHFQYLNESEK
jgi:hypothetical protein